jgi:putative tryptophan/tyrosine transport system substrate-binding protein
LKQPALMLMINGWRKTMKRERTIPAVIPALVAAGCLLITGCGGPPAPKTVRVGILCETSALAIAADGFREKMTELGYGEGTNIVYDLQTANSVPDRAREIAAKFVRDKVDLIFAFSTMAALTAKSVSAGSGIPVIFSIAGLEGNNLVANVREPGGNITGVRSPVTELPVKNFEVMLELLPRMRRVLAPYAAHYPAVIPGLEALRSAAGSAGITVVELPVATLEELKSYLKARDAAADIGMDAILCLPETLVQTPEGFALLSEFAARHKVPIGGLIPWEIRQGAVYTSGIDMREMGRLAAPLADKVLRGTKAGTIPVVSPELHLRINYKLALELGIIVPKGLLLQADEIIR